MRVLDLDLDFFLTEPCPFAEEGARPDDGCALPHGEERVRSFLEEGLLLSKARKTPGRRFETHDGAAFFWKELIGAGRLTVPFTVTHVDTHTDLGIAQKGYPFVKHSVLTRPPAARADFEAYREMGQLNEANYLAFVLACRYADRLENLRNVRSKPDFPEEMRCGRDIRLCTAFPQLFEAVNRRFALRRVL